MRCVRIGRLAALCLVVFHLEENSAVAQEAPRPVEITFFTADHVELAGTFYASPREKSSPCILLLHPINASRDKGGWNKLAPILQKDGYTVLSFDFRGHGQSKTVTPEFWQSPIWRTLKPIANAPANTIQVEQFTRPAHYATLVNDIRAARRVLELKAREGKCDASQIFVIGADTGASLGVLWINAEWDRFRMTKDASGRFDKQGTEALDIAGAVWLGFNRDWPGRTTIPVDNWLTPPTSERTPMGFLYAANDARGKSQALAAVDKLTKTSKEGVNKLTLAKDVPISTRTGGEALLEIGESIDEMILAYLSNARAAHRRAVRTPPDTAHFPPVFGPEAYGFR